ncbi:TonB-dependent receptor [Asticcacaulis sp.]|uniref:TonB-dependent receptor n=1 Tax=Asticcacaulis sp. TaxID=1872648 RepID=UPI0039E52927
MAQATAPTDAAASQDQASSAQADTPTSPATDKPAATKADVKPVTDKDGTTVITVTAQKPIYQHKIDRDVYDVTQDPQSATGSAADVLNNVPAVTVDSDGTVSLRGNSGVEVYVNGKKSAQMQGDSRAFTLQSLPADDIDTIEVIPNPGAAYGADTASGIINIVMKRGRTLKPHTSINLTAGNQGRAGLGLRTGKNFGKLSLNGGINLGAGMGGNGRGGGGGGPSGSSNKSVSESDRYTLDADTGDVTREDVSHSTSWTKNENASANLNAQYDINDTTDLSADLNYARRRSSSTGINQTQTYDANGNLTEDVTRYTRSSAPSENMDARLTFDHRGAVGSTEDFKMMLSHSGSLSNGVTYTRNASDYPDTDDTYTTRTNKSRNTIDEFSGDWSHPLGDYEKTQQQLQLGWSIQHTKTNSYNYQSQELDSEVEAPESPQSASQFSDDEVLSAIYGTYQRQLGKLGIQAGLRVENLKQDMTSTNLVSETGRNWTRNSTDYSPSLFVTYKLDDKEQLKFIYSRKIQRPQGSQLDPTIVYSDDGLTARSGNANLSSAKTDKFDFDYYRNTTLFDFSASLYYNVTTGNIEQVSYYLPTNTDVLLTTYQNSGRTRNAGFSGNLTYHTADRKLRIMFSPNIGYTVSNYMDASTHKLMRAEGPNSSANLRTFYRLNDKDNLTFGVNYRGKSVNVDGYRTAQTSLNASWMHQIIPFKLVLVTNLSNAIIGPTSKTVTDSSTTWGYSRMENPGTTFMMSLRYTFGQPIKRGPPDGPPPGDRRGPPPGEGPDGGPGMMPDGGGGPGGGGGGPGF